MGSAESIVVDLRGQGFLIRILEGGKFGISPMERLTPELRETVTANREDIYAFLEREQAEMSDEERKIARVFSGSYAPGGMDRLIALAGARIMASGCPLSITTSDGERFPIRNLTDYRAYVAHSAELWGTPKMMPLKIARK